MFIPINNVYFKPSKQDTIKIGSPFKIPNGYARIIPNSISLARSREELSTTKLEFPNSELKSILDTKKASLTLLPTLDCNLRCIYCYSKGGENKINMTKNIAKSAINYIKSLSDSDSLELGFHGGGEPLMNFNTVAFAANYSKEIFKEVYITLTTNGTVSKSKLEWIIDNCDMVRISNDGLAQDIQRPIARGKNSSQIVENNLKSIIGSDVRSMVQCVVTEKTISTMKDSIRYFHNLGLKYVKLEPAYVTNWTRGEQNMNPIVGTFVDTLLETLDMIVDENLDMKIDTGLFSRPTLGAYCGVHGSNFIVTPEGYVSSCPEVGLKNHELADTMIYAKLTEDGNLESDEKKLSKLKMMHFSNYPKCSDCDLKLVCRSGCSAKNINEKGFSYQPSEVACKMEKLFVPELLSRILLNPKYADVVMENHKLITY